MNTRWHDPDVSVIYLTDGQTVLAEVNGLDLEETSGYAFVQGREIEVARLDHTDEWAEMRGKRC